MKLSDIPKLYFRKGYKYATDREYRFQTPFRNMAARIDAKSGGQPWVALYESGLLVIREGYPWDGASGPTIDTKSSYLPSLIHDAFYQLGRACALAQDMRDEVDAWFKELCLACGMWKIRANYWHLGVAFGAKSSFSPRAPKVFEAP